MKTSAIGWTDYSGGPLNFVRGCTPVSEGCANCYARAIYDRFGRDFSQVICDDDALRKLLTMRFPEYSPKRGDSRPMAFVCDTGDLFHESVSDRFICWCLWAMYKRADVTWQILTKRPERMRTLVTEWLEDGQPPDNIWLGVTAENQRRADARIPILLDTPVAVRFVSVEPMLEAMRLDSVRFDPWTEMNVLEGVGQTSRSGMRGQTIPNCRCKSLDWVICGAESGPKRRPFEVAWALDLYEQCREAGVPFFGKQASGLRPGVPLSLPGHGIVQEWPKKGAR